MADNPSARSTFIDVASRRPKSNQPGLVKVNSSCRGRSHSAKVGGATHSKHLTGDAADFSVGRNKPAVLGWLQRQPSVGGLKLYAGGRGHFHIDTGPRRTW